MSSVTTRRHRIPPSNIVDRGDGTPPELKLTQRVDGQLREVVVRDLTVKKDAKGNYWCDLPHLHWGSRLGFALKNPATAVKGHKTKAEVRDAMHAIERTDLGFNMMGVTGTLVAVAIGQTGALYKWNRCPSLPAGAMQDDCYVDRYVALATVLVAGVAAMFTGGRAILAWKSKVLEEAEKEADQAPAAPVDLAPGHAPAPGSAQRRAGAPEAEDDGIELREIRIEQPGAASQQVADQGTSSAAKVRFRRSTQREILDSLVPGGLPDGMEVVVHGGGVSHYTKITEP